MVSRGVRRFLLALVGVALLVGVAGCGDDSKDKVQNPDTATVRDGPFGFDARAFERELTERDIDLIPARRRLSDLETAPGPIEFRSFDTPDGSEFDVLVYDGGTGPLAAEETLSERLDYTPGEQLLIAQNVLVVVRKYGDDGARLRQAMTAIALPPHGDTDPGR